VVAVVTRPDKPAGRGKQVAPPPVKTLATELGVAILQPPTLKAPGVIEELAALAPDVFVVVAYGRILPPAALAVPRLGPWNVHGSLLPRYRGAAPIQWSIIRGETETGVCLMQMEAGLDTGPVAACLRTPIGPEDTAGTLSERLAALGALVLTENLPLLAEGRLTLSPQDHAAHTLAPPLKKEDGHLDFTAPAAAVSARARGVDPWPGPTATLDGEPIKLFSPRVREGTGAPGVVLGASADGLLVACGQGAVAFGELHLPGRKRLPAGAVLAGRPIPPGTRLG
jgi:methionyl-tRNA formyltransferase